MSRLRLVGEVARWELRRYSKPKQMVAGFFMTVAILLGITWFGRIADGPSAVELAVVGAEHLPTLPEQAGRFELRRHDPGDEARLRDRVAGRDLDGLLFVGPDGDGELYTRQRPAWREDLERELSMALALHRIERSGIDPAALAALQAPFRLEVTEAAPRAGRAAAITALIAIGLMLFGLFTGMAYIFASVTGEKQQRVSEQVVSAIPAQTWIDGKILGLSGVAVIGMASTVLAVFTWFGLRRVIWGDAIPVPPAVEAPGLLALALAFIVVGFLFWFAFITAIAALIDDPHTSNRGHFIFLPVLASMPAFLAITDPGATWARGLSLAPPTSAAVMPARFLVTDVPAWEILVAAALLLLATHLVRRAAGRIFRLAMLMYGKEPGWGEVRRWIRES